MPLAEVLSCTDGAFSVSRCPKGDPLSSAIREDVMASVHRIAQEFDVLNEDGTFSDRSQIRDAMLGIKEINFTIYVDRVKKKKIHTCTHREREREGRRKKKEGSWF